MVVGVRQSFKFFRENTRFLENNRALSKVLYGIWHYLICITKLSKKSVHISQFYINHTSHLNVWLVSGQGPLALKAQNFAIKL